MNKHIDIREFRYLIYTEREKGYYFGCWINLATGDKGESSKHCVSETEALTAGEHNARCHYGHKYGYKEEKAKPDDNPKGKPVEGGVAKTDDNAKAKPVEVGKGN